MLDEGELAPLVKQLSDQIDFNNALLEEMAKLEETHLTMQEEQKNKGHALRQSQEVATSARSEASEWRRKFAISQEVAETNAGKLAEVRVEFGGLRREADAAAAELRSTKVEKAESERVKDSLAKSLEAAEGELRESSSVGGKYKEEMGEKYAALGNANVALTEQVDEFRKKSNHLDGDLAKLRERLRLSEDDTRSAEVKTAAEAAAKEEVLLRERGLESEASKLKQAGKRLESESRDSAALAENAGQSLAAAQKDLAACRSELTERDESVAGLKRNLAAMETGASRSSRALEEARSQLASASKARAETNLHHERKLAEAQEKNARLLDEMRVMGQEGAHDAQRRAAEAAEKAAECEDRLANNDKEMASLHELLSKGNTGTQQMLDAFAKERDAYEASIRGLNGALAEKEAGCSALEEEKEKVLEISAAQIKGLKNSAQETVKSFLGTIEELQLQVKRVSESHGNQKDEMGEMTSQFVTLATFVRSLEVKNAEPINGWFKEVVKGFELLIEQNSAVKAGLEEMKDDAKKSSLGKLDEQSKTLMLEEEVSRLEFDVQTAEQERDAKDDDFRAAQKSHKDLTASGQKELGEAKALLNQYKAKLDKSEARCNDLQKKTAGTGELLADAHKTSSERHKSMEDKVNELETALRKVQREQQILLEHRDGLQKAAEERERETRLGKSDLEQTEKRWSGVADDLKKKMDRVGQNLADSNKTNQQLQKQCEQTKKLLLTIQQQRAHLNDENAQLKGELEEAYQRQTSASSSPSPS